jgi:hypothetical protein
MKIHQAPQSFMVRMNMMRGRGKMVSPWSFFKKPSLLMRKSSLDIMHCHNPGIVGISYISVLVDAD